MHSILPKKLHQKERTLTFSILYLFVYLCEMWQSGTCYAYQIGLDFTELFLLTLKCDKESGHLGFKNQQRFIGDSIIKVKPSSMYFFRVSAQEHHKLSAKLVGLSHMHLVIAA